VAERHYNCVVHAFKPSAFQGHNSVTFPDDQLIDISENLIELLRAFLRPGAFR